MDLTFSVFMDMYKRVKLLDHMATLYLIFEVLTNHFSRVVVPFYSNYINNIWRFLFSTSSAALVIIPLFDTETDLHFPNDGQEEKGMTEDEMAGWHHWLYGHESGWTLEVGDGQGSLVCCSPWGCNKSDTIEQLNWTELNWSDFKCSWS